MKRTDVEIANQLLENIKRIDAELQRIDELAGRISTEKARVCCKFKVISEEEHEAEVAGYQPRWLNLDMKPHFLHAHCSESEMLEMFGIMVSWRKAERREIVKKLRAMGVTDY